MTASKGKAKKKNEQKDSENIENHSPDESESNLNLNKNKPLESAAKCDNNKSKAKTNDSKDGVSTTVISPAGGHGGGSGEAGGGGGSGKKKKKKGANNNNNGGGGNNGVNSVAAPAHTELQTPGGQMNLSPTRQQSHTYYPEGYYATNNPMAYVATYRPYPMGRVGGYSSYYVPSSSSLPYMHAGLVDHEIYQLQSAPLVSFEIFSDENANGCSIM